MPKRALPRFVVWCLLLLLTQASPAKDPADKREREMLRRMQQQLQQVQAQLSSLEKERVGLSQSLDKAAREAKAAQGRAARLDRELKTERQQREDLTKELERARQDLASERERLARSETRLADTQKILEQTSRALTNSEEGKRHLEGVRTRQEREIALCEDKNKRLYVIGRELMVRFEQKSCNEILAQREPFTGLKRVEVENLLEEYRDKLDEQRLIKPPGG